MPGDDVIMRLRLDANQGVKDVEKLKRGFDAAAGSAQKTAKETEGIGKRLKGVGDAMSKVAAVREKFNLALGLARGGAGILGELTGVSPEIEQAARARAAAESYAGAMRGKPGVDAGTVEVYMRAKDMARAQMAAQARARVLIRMNDPSAAAMLDQFNANPMRVAMEMLGRKPSEVRARK